jgi:hypothetical protein
VTDPRVLLEADSDGQRLRVVVRGLAAPNAADLDARLWMNMTIEVEAHPFTATIETLVTTADIDEIRAIANGFAAGDVACTIGGGRAAQIELSREGDVIEVKVTASGDDPWPRITYLISGSRVHIEPTA